MQAQRDDRVALALGAGGARGLAQIGVIEAIQARGLEIAAVAGSSSGALVGGVFAAGKLAEFRESIEALDRGAFLRLLSDPALGEGGLFHGHRLVAAMRAVVGDPDIETLPIPFIAVAVDLMRQREVWLRGGPLWQALRASFAIPGLFTPALVHGRELVDGGLLAPLPITATRLSDAHRLIAVDMHGWPERPSGALPDERVDEDDGHGLAAWIERRVHRHWPEHGENAIGLTEVMARSLDTMQAQIARVQLALDPPEVVIRIPRDACLFYEFWRAKELVEIGRKEAEKALDAAGY
ncbi:serine protease [Pseudoluteimonas lycopersici]|uniref:Serine protease n=1 Tax=Pseudoluteimonas lycopersici TaxID=1324796 RepID=A0A516V6Z2_9GAMM|nr:patatin-like phospholipase family protein [Lysobacter lycopersici]QDQ74280.1 serine protease [Lysobacter lycopersici]